MKLRAEYRLAMLLLGSVLVVAAVIGLLVLFRGHIHVVRLIEKLHELGFWGVLGFIGVMALTVILLLPGIFFTVGAGFFFGPVLGSVCVVVGTAVGAAAAFLVGRYGLGARAERFVRSRPRLQSLTREFTGEGWKLILLTRLIPFFPFKLSNYFFGLSGFHFRGFLLGTTVGIIPLSVTNVYMGSMAADITAVTTGAVSRTPAVWAVQVAGLLALAVFLVMLTGRARRALERARSADAGRKTKA